jgi:hypothetical protein
VRPGEDRLEERDSRLGDGERLSRERLRSELLSNSEEIDSDLVRTCLRTCLRTASSGDRDRDRELPLEYDEDDSDALSLRILFLSPLSSLPSSEEEYVETLSFPEEYVETLSLRLLFRLSISLSFNTLSAIPDLRQRFPSPRGYFSSSLLGSSSTLNFGSNCGFLSCWVLVGRGL